jgi:hypothetical protein
VHPEAEGAVDTDPKVAQLPIAALRRLPPWRKLEQVVALTERTTVLALADIRRRHPHASDRELRLRLASRRMDPALLRAAFGWDVAVQGY